MNHIMLRAEFPGAEQEELREIHDWLIQRNWVQVTNAVDEVHSVWHGTFNRRMLEKDCHDSAINAFIEASKRYCQVQLDILWAACKPATQGSTLLSS